MSSNAVIFTNFNQSIRESFEAIKKWQTDKPYPIKVNGVVDLPYQFIKSLCENENLSDSEIKNLIENEVKIMQNLPKFTDFCMIFT